MKVYKRSVGTLIRGLVSSLFACVIVYFAINYFLKRTAAAIAVTAIIGLTALYFSVLHNSVHVEIDDQGFRFYRRGKLKNEVKFQDVVSYQMHSSQENDTDNLTFVLGDDSSVIFDIYPLGMANVGDIWEDLTHRLGESQELDPVKEE